MWCNTTLKLRRPVSECFFQPPGIPRCLLARGWRLSQLETFAEKREWEAGRSARESRYPCHPDTPTCVFRPSMPESGSLWSWSQVKPNTNHAELASQVERQVEKKAYTHDTDSKNQANRQGRCVRETETIIGKAPRLGIPTPVRQTLSRV